MGIEYFPLIAVLLFGLGFTIIILKDYQAEIKANNQLNNMMKVSIKNDARLS
jgi:hypothetical protein